MNEIFNIGNVFQTNETILEFICKALIEIAENYYDTVGFYLDKIAGFTIFLIDSNIERLKILGFEFWCRLGTEEADRVKHKSINKGHPKYYIQPYFEKLKNIIEKNILPKSTDDLEDDWNSSKASCFILSKIVQVIDNTNFENICLQIRELFKNKLDQNQKYKALMMLTCAFESIHKSLAFQLALQFLFKLLNILETEDPYSRLLASKALVKLTKLSAKFLEPNNLNRIIPVLQEMIYTDNRIGLNICLCLNNMVTVLGDQGTNKSTSKSLLLNLIHFRSIFSLF